MMNRRATLFFGAALSTLLAACGSGGGGGGTAGAGGPNPAPSTFQLGDPIGGLTQAEEEAFHRGRVIFEKVFRPSEGLGPMYNATSCASCHSTPVTGGSAKLYRNFYLARIGSPNAQFDIPGLPSAVVPSYGQGPHVLATFALDRGRSVIPSNFGGTPVTSAQRNSIPMFGVGLFEFIPDTTISANADPEDTITPDGISGRFNTDAGALGRFGVKAQSNNIELFTRAPLQNQMGITTNPFLGAAGTVSLAHAAPLQVSANPNDPTLDNDGVPDPEMSHDDLGDLIAFTRFLAPPQPQPFTSDAAQGEVLFDSIGCTKCHIPTLQSSRGPVNAYTDLLLHDMGPELADGLSIGLPQISPSSPFNTASEFRTQPLWGVSMHAPFLHDGRAETLDEAITMHGGEAAAIRDAYVALPQTDKDDIIEFLEHL